MRGEGDGGNERGRGGMRWEGENELGGFMNEPFALLLD